MLKKEIIHGLIKLGAVKSGEFTLKSGIISPIYIDLRMIISEPELLKKIATLMLEKSEGLNYDLIAGIPYTALPIATIMSTLKSVPMIYSRKEVKSYGTKKLIEGIFKENEKVLIVDDLITDGSSKFETFDKFEKEKLNVKDVVVLVDREQGGAENLKERGYTLHSMISIFEILEEMKEIGRISDSEDSNIRDFLKQNRSNK